MSTELSVEIDAASARVLTDRIKIGVDAVWELVTQAYMQRAWSALGYRSWDDYCTREFGTTRLRLPREDRAEVVASLRESGLSIRAIASATGAGYGTIRRELGGEPNGSRDEPDADVDEDALADELIIAEQQLPPLPENYMNIPGAVSDSTPGQTGRVAEALDHARQRDVATPPKPVIGIDGKQYRPFRKQRTIVKRRPVSDIARDLGLDIDKLSDRIERLAADDRLAEKKSEVAPMLGHYLNRLIECCHDLDRQLAQGE